MRIKAAVLLIACMVSGCTGVLDRPPAQLPSTATLTVTNNHTDVTMPPSPTPSALPSVTPAPIVQLGAAISIRNASQLTQLGILGWGIITATAFQPDGTLLTVASGRGIHVHDMNTLQKVYSQEVSDAAGPGVALSPDGQVMATGSWDGTGRIWNAVTGDLMHDFPGPSSYVRSMAFSPDGAIVAFGYGNGVIQLFEVSRGAALGKFQAHTERVNVLAFSPDGSALASGSDIGQAVIVWAVADRKPMTSMEGCIGRVSALSYSPDGTLLAKGVWDGTVSLSRTSDGRLVDTWAGRGAIRALGFSPDGTTLASGSDRGDVWLREIPGGELVHALDQHVQSITSVTFSADGVLLASSDTGGKLMIWDATQGTLLGSAGDYAGGVSKMVFSPRGDMLASVHSLRTVQVWSVIEGTEVYRLFDPLCFVSDVAFSDTGERLGTASCGEFIDYPRARGGRIRMLNVSNWKVIERQETVLIGYAALSPDLSMIANATIGFSLVSTGDGRRLPSLTGHAAQVRSVGFSDDGMSIVSGSDDETARLWRASDGKLIHILEGHSGTVRAVAFSPGGQLVATRASDGARVWQVRDGSLVAMFGGHAGPVRSLAISPDGTIMASGDGFGTLRLWREGRRRFNAKLSPRAHAESVKFGFLP